MRYKAARQASPPELAEMARQVKAAKALSERAELVEDSGAFTNAVMRAEIDWKNSVETVRGQVTVLKNEIEQATLELPGSAKIGGVLGKLDQQLNKVAAMMSQSLAADGKAGYPTNTTKSLAGIRKLLISDPVLSRLDDNPFLETTVIASLSETLDQVEISLRV